MAVEDDNVHEMYAWFDEDAGRLLRVENGWIVESRRLTDVGDYQVTAGGIKFESAPDELRFWISVFWPESEWDNAASIANLESGLDPFARRDTRDIDHPCGSVIALDGGTIITAELSVGYFQINTCNYADVEPERFYNGGLNVETAYGLWQERGWEPWYYSATELGLIPST